MSALFERAGFEAFALTLLKTHIVHQWGDASVAKIGPRIFSVFDKDGGEIWFKASQMAFDMLPELPGIRPAPYLARAGWVAVGPDAPLTDAELRAYVGEAYRLVVERLTRRERLELGLLG